MTGSPIEARRIRPGEYRLAAGSIEIGDQFQTRDAVYEVVSEPRRWGLAWVANVRFVEGGPAGKEFQAMLHTTEEDV